MFTFFFILALIFAALNDNKEENTEYFTQKFSRDDRWSVNTATLKSSKLTSAKQQQQQEKLGRLLRERNRPLSGFTWRTTDGSAWRKYENTHRPFIKNSVIRLE